MFAAVEHCCGADPSMCKCCCCCLRPPSTPAHPPSHLPLLQCSNSKIRSLVVDMEGGLEAMAALGWQQAEEEGEQVLTLAKGAATMAQVRRGGQCWCPPMRGAAAQPVGRGGMRGYAAVHSTASLLSFATAASVVLQLRQVMLIGSSHRCCLTACPPAPARRCASSWRRSRSSRRATAS